jgi:hypothetical protein
MLKICISRRDFIVGRTDEENVLMFSCLLIRIL